MEVSLIGASGMVGNALLKNLVSDERIKRVHVFARNEIAIKDPKISFHKVDFNHLEDWKHLIVGDGLFSALGTTLKAAGSKENQYKVDFTYQYEVAFAARENGVDTMVLISAKGADSRSKFFYVRMKGELEEAILKLDYKKIKILKPGFLIGDRKDKRTSEECVHSFIKYFPKLGRKLTSGIEASTVADTALKAFYSQDKSVFIDFKD